MSTLAETTWTFSTTGALAGTIYFQMVGPSPNAGVATITATNPPIGYNGPTTWQAAWAEVSDGNHFAVQFSDFMTTQSFNPPPVGVPTINAGQLDMQPVTLFGSHANGIATLFGTNFQTQDANGNIVIVFNMQRQ